MTELQLPFLMESGENSAMINQDHLFDFFVLLQIKAAIIKTINFKLQNVPFTKSRKKD